MMLVDSDILRHKKQEYIDIVPWNEGQLGSNSYDLTLSDKILTYTGETLDCKRENDTKLSYIPKEGMIIYPGILYLSSTREYTYTHESLVPQLEGKSSLARLGIQVHMTAGFGDCGFRGHWTLEITTVHAVRIYADMPIAQIYYFQTLGKCIRPYNRKPNAKYHDQGPLPVSSAMHKNFI